MENRWKQVKLEDILNFRRGHDLSKKNMSGDNYPVVGSNGIIGYHNEFIKKSPCVTIGRSGNIGTPYYYNQDCWPHNTTLYIDDFKGNDEKYIFYLLKKLDFKRYAGGSAVPTLNRNHIHPIDVFVTLDVNEQKAIAKILSDLDEKIETNNKINKKLEEMAQAIFKQWFVDFEFPNEDGKPYKSSGGEMVESELGMIPKGWSIEDLSNLMYFQEGPGIRNWQYVEENGIKFINIKCIKNNDLDISTANMISNEEAEGKYSHFMIDERDIVMSCSGTLGKYAIVRKEHLPLCLNTSVIRFKPLKDSKYYSYIYSYLTSRVFYEKLITMACGSVQANFGPTHLKKIRMISPSVNIIKKYNNLVLSLINKISLTRSENDKLTNTRNTLLPKLMSGEIRVPID